MLTSNKRGQSNVLFFALVMILILAIGTALAFTGAIANWFSNEITPSLRDLGVVGSSNLTEIADVTLTPVNSMINSSTWMIGVVYFVMLLGGLFLAFGFRNTQNSSYAILFFILMLVLVIVSIYISNTYENFYNGNDVIGTELKAMTLASFLIINSPVIVLIIGFIGAIVMLLPAEEGTYY